MCDVRRAILIGTITKSHIGNHIRHPTIHPSPPSQRNATCHQQPQQRNRCSATTPTWAAGRRSATAACSALRCSHPWACLKG
jgi:hypothetical protein